MFTKQRMLALLCTGVMLTACGTDNSGNTVETEEKERVPVAELFDGYEELQGKDFDIFTLPETIEKPE